MKRRTEKKRASRVRAVERQRHVFYQGWHLRFWFVQWCTRELSPVPRIAPGTIEKVSIRVNIQATFDKGREKGFLL